jgi:NhaA family Na+:H+ antiporter
MSERRILSIRLSDSFQRFFSDARAGSIILVVCTAISLCLANSSLGEGYIQFWRQSLGPLSLELWINDGLMAVFFLLVGLELQRELLEGELSSVKRALLPMFAALGGVAVPALIHLGFNYGTTTQSGMGIPMATDIAFAIGALSLLGNRIPASLKVFLTALAVIDDLAAIVVIAFFYSGITNALFLFGALAVLVLLYILRRRGVASLAVFLTLGFAMWILMLKSGVHATIAGVLLGLLIPLRAKTGKSPAGFLEHLLNKPVHFFVLPLFALGNTAISVHGSFVYELISSNGMGIFFGLLVGKPIGIVLASFLVISLGVCRLPADVSMRHIVGAGMLGGIGFTMAIFISNLAFDPGSHYIDGSKLAIMTASLGAATLGLLWLSIFGRPHHDDSDLDTMEVVADQL